MFAGAVWDKSPFDCLQLSGQQVSNHSSNMSLLLCLALSVFLVDARDLTLQLSKVLPSESPLAKCLDGSPPVIPNVHNHLTVVSGVLLETRRR